MARAASSSYASWLRRVPILTMTATYCHEVPPVLFNELDHLSYFHTAGLLHFHQLLLEVLDLLRFAVSAGDDLVTF